MEAERILEALTTNPLRTEEDAIDYLHLVTKFTEAGLDQSPEVQDYFGSLRKAPSFAARFEKVRQHAVYIMGRGASSLISGGLELEASLAQVVLPSIRLLGMDQIRDNDGTYPVRELMEDLEKLIAKRTGKSEAPRSDPAGSTDSAGRATPAFGEAARSESRLAEVAEVKEIAPSDLGFNRWVMRSRQFTAEHSPSEIKDNPELDKEMRQINSELERLAFMADPEIVLPSYVADPGHPEENYIPLAAYLKILVVMYALRSNLSPEWSEHLEGWANHYHDRIKDGSMLPDFASQQRHHFEYLTEDALRFMEISRVQGKLSAEVQNKITPRLKLLVENLDSLQLALISSRLLDRSNYSQETKSFFDRAIYDQKGSVILDEVSKLGSRFTSGGLKYSERMVGETAVLRLHQAASRVQPQTLDEFFEDSHNTTGLKQLVDDLIDDGVLILARMSERNRQQVINGLPDWMRQLLDQRFKFDDLSVGSADSVGPASPASGVASRSESHPFGSEPQGRRLAEVEEVKDTPEVNDENKRWAELREKEEKLLDQIVAEGGPLLRTWTFEGSWDGSTAMQYINPEGKRYYKGYGVTPEYWDTDTRFLFDKSLMDYGHFLTPMKANGINEVAIIKPTTKDRMATRKVRVKKVVPQKDFLGRTKMVEVKSEVDESYVAGQDGVTVGEALGSNSTESAATLLYHISSWGVYGRRDNTMLDGVGRSGNFIDFKVIFPESLAREAAQVIQQDPGFIRHLMFEMINRKFSQRFRSTTMSTFGVPPYDVWEQESQPKMYFVDALSNPEDAEKMGNLDFDPTKVIRFNTKTVDGYNFAVREAPSSPRPPRITPY